MARDGDGEGTAEDPDIVSGADPAVGGEPPAEVYVDDTSGSPIAKWLRIALLAFMFFGALGIAKVTGLDEQVSVSAVRSFMEGLGPLGFGVFVVVFAVGELLHIPGMVFVLAAAIAYGRWLGALAAYVGAVTSVTTSFLVVRTVGGQPLAGLRWRFARRVLDRLDSHPIQTVAILRVLFWLAPLLNYVLAMSKIRFRDYLIGSALGLLIPVPLAALLFEWVGDRFGLL